MMLPFPNERDVESNDWQTIFDEIRKRVCLDCIDLVTHTDSIKEMTYTLLDAPCGAEIILWEDDND